MTLPDAAAGAAHLGGRAGSGPHTLGSDGRAVLPDLDAVWVQLNEADASSDPEELARIAWDLYAGLGQLHAEDTRLRAAVADLARRARGPAR
jgi:hypothetical protein